MYFSGILVTKNKPPVTYTIPPIYQNIKCGLASKPFTYFPKNAKCKIGILVLTPRIKNKLPLNLLNLGPWKSGYKVHTNTIKEKVDIIVKYVAPIPIKWKILLNKIFTNKYHNNKSRNMEDNMNLE